MTAYLRETRQPMGFHHPGLVSESQGSDAAVPFDNYLLILAWLLGYLPPTGTPNKPMVP